MGRKATRPHGPAFVANSRGRGGSGNRPGWCGRRQAQPNEPRPGRLPLRGEGAARPFPRRRLGFHRHHRCLLADVGARHTRGSSPGWAETPARWLGRRACADRAVPGRVAPDRLPAWSVDYGLRSMREVRMPVTFPPTDYAGLYGAQPHRNRDLPVAGSLTLALAAVPWPSIPATTLVI